MLFFSLTSSIYEILVAIHSKNWGCVLRMDSNLFVEIPDDVYFSLRDLLKLNWKKDHFSSAVFLRLLSENAPKKSSYKGVDYKELRKYLPYRYVDEKDKIYFCGWNDHIKDKRKAHNFDKTEFYFGKTVADYCRKHNISSLWSDIPRDEQKLAMPWNK